VLLFIALFGLQSAVPRPGAAAEEPKRVVIVFGEDLNHPAVSSLNRALRVALSTESPDRAEIYGEDLALRRPADQYEKELLSLLPSKYNSFKFDLVFAVSPTALQLRLSEPTLWQSYKWYLAIIISAILIEALLIIWLLSVQARRKHAEQRSEHFALLASIEHHRLQEVIANLPGVIWELRIDPATGQEQVEFVSQNVEKMLGYSVEEWQSTPQLGRSIVDVRDRDSLERAVENVLVTGKEGVLRYRWQRKDGTTLWVETHLVAIRDEAGRATGLRGMTMDISERKLIETVLTEREAQLAGIIGSAMDAIISIDSTQRIVLFNAAAEKIFGCSAEQAHGQLIERFIPERFKHLHQEHIRNFGNTQLTKLTMGAQLPLTAINAAGQEFPIEAAISQVDVNGSNYYTVILRDISERQRAEQELKQSESNSRTVFNAANDAIFVHDSNTGTILDANQRMSEMYGFTLDEVRTLTVSDLSSNEPGYKQHDAMRYIQKAANGEPQLFEWRAKHKTGRLFWVEVNLRHAVVRGKGVLLAVVRDITVRKDTVDELRRSEERFAKAFRVNPQPMSVTTVATGRYLEVNDSFLAMSGYRRDEVIGHSAIELAIWETPERRSEFIQLLNEHGSIVNMETMFRTKNGSLRVLLSSAELLEFSGEDCLLVASSDITERVQAESALVESEERFRNLAATAPVMIWMSDQNQDSTYFNSQWLDFTGRKLEEEIGDGWLEGVWPNDRARCIEMFSTSFDRRTSFRMEYRLRAADGGYRWVYDSGTPRFSATGEFLGYIGSCIDITERKTSEEAIRSAQTQMRLIADSLPVLISHVDTNGCYTFSNRTYESWFAESPEKIKGRHMRDVLGDDAWQRIRPRVETTLAGEQVHFEDWLANDTGPIRWVSVDQIPMRNGSGTINGFVSLVSDVTERRQTEETLRTLSGRLINAQEEERSRVARELHDDLSQQMAILSIELSQLAAQVPESETNLQTRIKRLKELSHDVATEIHRLSYQLHPAKLDHLGLVSALKSFCHELAEHQVLEIEFQQRGFPATLSKDVTLCAFRIAQEALRNVVKHSGASLAKVRLNKTDKGLYLVISDDGCGFDTSSPSMKSGLGLLGMEERLRLVGGKLEIRSRPGRGVVIKVSIPMKLTDSLPGQLVEVNSGDSNN